MPRQIAFFPFLTTLFLLITVARAGNLPEVVLYDFSGTGLSKEDASVLTLKLKNALEADWGKHVIRAAESGTKLPAECNNTETAKKAGFLSGAPLIFWGNVGRIGKTYMTSVYLYDANNPEKRYTLFQEEVDGELSDVLRTSIVRIAARIMGRPIPGAQVALPAALTPVPAVATSAPQAMTQDSGWVNILVTGKRSDLFLDNHQLSKGITRVKTTVGSHRVSAVAGRMTRMDTVEVAKDGLVNAEIDMREPVRAAKLRLSAQGTNMIGERYVFGPTLEVGLILKGRHILGVMANAGFEGDDNSTMIGGGLVYLISLNVHNVFIANFGATSGFWEETWEDEYYYSRNYYYDTVHEEYFGGPKLSLEVGYKHVFFNFLDATCLLGSDIKLLLGSGITLRF